MGTTVCAAGLLSDGHVALVNVGDSRCYLFHEGTLTRVTQDHSLTAELIERGELQEDDATKHPYYGILTRAMGVGSEIEIDRRTIAVEVGDRIALCSDGLFTELSDEMIGSALVGDTDVETIVDKLIESAIASGGHDNVPVVVAEVVA